MQRNLVKIIIIVLIVIMVLVSVIGTILIVATDMFKSKDVLFKRYIAQNVMAMSNIFDFSDEKDLVQILTQKDYMAMTSGTLKYLKNDNDEEEIYNLKLGNIVKNSEEKSYEKIKVNFDKYTLAEVEFLKEGEIYGLNLPNLINKFICIKNESLPYLISSLGYDNQYISEKLGMNFADYLEILNFSDEELQSLQSSYADAIFSGISQQAYSSKNDVMITLKNGQSPYTTAYILTLTQNDLDKVYKRILNHTVENEIILQKVELLEQKLKETGLNITEDESLKDRFVSYLTEKSNSIEYTGTNEQTTTFTVYRDGEQTVRTTIENGNSLIIIDLDSIQSGTINITKTQLDETGTKTNTENYVLTKKSIDNEFKREFLYSDDTNNFKFNTDVKKLDTTIEGNFEMEYSSDEIARIRIETATTVDTQSDQEIPVEFSKENRIILNKYKEQQISTVYGLVENRVIQNIRDIKSKANTKLLSTIVDKIDDIEKSKTEEIENTKKQEIQEFNNQFVLYAGENLDYDNMERLLDVISHNIKDYELVKGRKIRILIEEGSENKEKMKEIKSAVIDRYKYNVDFHYDEENKISAIDIYLYIER